MKDFNELEYYFGSISTERKKHLIKTFNFLCQLLPSSLIRFNDGKNSEGKIVSNPSIGFGSFEQRYATNETKEFPQITLSATQKGISIHLLGVRGKLDLKSIVEDLGTSDITGYCIRFKQWDVINQKALAKILLSAFSITSK